jgi:hypothetical protein
MMDAFDEMVAAAFGANTAPDVEDFNVCVSFF